MGLFYQKKCCVAYSEDLRISWMFYLSKNIRKLQIIIIIYKSIKIVIDLIRMNNQKLRM